MNTKTEKISYKKNDTASEKDFTDTVKSFEGQKYQEIELQKIFNAFAVNQSNDIELRDIVTILKNAGLKKANPKVAQLYKQLENFNSSHKINFSTFKEIIYSDLTIKKALKSELIIPDFKNFCGKIKEIYDVTLSNTKGKVSNYIPQLQNVDPNKFAISICTVDGQQYSLGDSDEYFSLQSTIKPINYCLALEEFTEKTVHKYVGREPSGKSFNELTLNTKGKPHNPLINAGAIVTTSLIKPHLNPADRFDYVQSMWKKLFSNVKPNFNNALYLSEKDNAHRNFALAYFMKGSDSFPKNTNFLEALDLYLQSCAMESTTELISIATATLAAFGSNPLTDERVLKKNTVKNCLSLMSSCGMYEFSGEFAFSVGLPAKSGVSGGVLLVVPNLMGITIWSPRVDESGNSVRGIDFAQRLVAAFNFHMYDGLTDYGDKKVDPRKRKDFSKIEGMVTLCWAASQGNLSELIQLISAGVDPGEGDYDGRTPMHLAAEENQLHIIEYLISQNININPKDRWENTPLDNAMKKSHTDIVNLLINNNGICQKDSSK